MENNNNDKSLSKVDLLYHLLNNSKLYYLNESFKKSEFIERLTEVLKTKYNFQTQIIEDNNINYIIYSSGKGIKSGIGLSVNYKIAFLIDNNKLFYEIKPEKWFENHNSPSIFKKIFNSSREEDIESEISNIIIKNQNKTLNINKNNCFIEKISHREEVCFYSIVDNNEVLLAFLNFSELKKSNFEIENIKDIKWKYFLTQKRSLIFGFNKKGEIVKEIDLSNTEFNVKKEIGRNPFVFSDIIFYTTRANSKLFVDIKSINKLSEHERIRKIALLNWLEDKKHKEFSIYLFNIVSEFTNNPFDKLTLFYLTYKSTNKTTLSENFIDNDKLKNIFQGILNFEGAAELLISLVEKWEIEYIDAIAINKLLLETMIDAVQANNVIEFHKLVRGKFLKKNKDKIDKVVFDIEYAKHHIKCGLINDAKYILNKILKHLPDESILDILPNENVDLTSIKSGQILKLTILELLSELEAEKISIEHKRQIAILQPMVEKRIDALIKISDNSLSEKAKIIKEVMQENGLSRNINIDSNFKYKVLKNRDIKANLMHPASRKGGSFSNIQKWLASVKIPNHSIIKSYSEILSKKKYSKLNTIITDIKYALSIENIEVYISRGEKSVGITGFEGEPLFLIIGSEHLNENSPHYLTYNELKYAVAIEIAHLYFKHSRITSSDVWKGAFEKGYWVFDTVFTVLPFAGLFGKSIQGFKKLNSVSQFLQKADKIGVNKANSKEIIKTTNQAIEIYNTKFSKEKQDDKEAEFIATSRIMQLTADRTALVFINDINSAIRAMFLVSQRYYKELPIVEKYGLREFLLKKEDAGNYKHQELAIRLSNLFAFYISDEYEIIYKLLYNK